MKNRPGEKIKLASLDELLGVVNEESAMEIEINKIHAFKNHPFIRGADASATIYSITETALLNGLKPYLYLTYVLDQLRRMGSFPEEEKLDQLLPWSKELPEELRTTE